MRTAYAYQIDGEPVDHRQFTAAACNPARSVVVEACAGSGKTWLLVARMLRLLLAGAEPSELLAVTFTRKAAQEMRERLDQLLHELALADDAGARRLLSERGVPERELENLLPAARTLYRRVLASPQGLSIDTFHSWFGRLVQVAPLTAGVPHGYTLNERSGELVEEAWRLFMQSLNGIDRGGVRDALSFLYEAIGDTGAESMLKNFLAKRAEWWAATQNGAGGEEPAPLTWLRELCGEDGERDARLSLWDDSYLLAQLRQVAALLGQGTKKNQDRAIAIESALSAAPGVDSFEALRREFFTQAGEPTKNLKTKDLLKALEAHYGAEGASAFDTEFDSIGMMLDQLERRSWDIRVVELNRALFTAGAALLEHYREVKAAQRAFDFTDLEWHAYRLLSDEGHAAYLQSRLDARYKHILLDEFQDTNPLQWNVVRAWLEAYGMDTAQPSVFIVGDPKQSIYRFRRAEPRVFDGARELLKVRGASVLRTSQTRRNAGAIIDVLNASQQGNPIYAPQTTMATADGAVWRLPLVVRRVAEEDGAVVSAPLRNPLTTALEEEEDARRLDEGRAVAVALRHALDELRKSGPAGWRDVMLLVRQRKHLAAYERALRDAGIPYVSDKRGGLLDAVEVRDLIALLTFLITPGDDRALAHVLKSPIAGASDADLIALATMSAADGGGHWWDRLRQAVRDASGAAAHLAATAGMLQGWMDDAAHLPVHDLLDRILHQGRLMERYAQSAPAATRMQTLANIEAFTELALNLDAGRYPSLPKFIDALRSLQEGADNEAPDEAGVAVAEDAVRILTIHSAKGLEAPIVFLLDSNHSKPKRDDSGILCDWPQQETRPLHFSAFGKRAERGMARSELFAAEERYKEQEDWNLLYVATTRAKNMLIVSGVHEARNAQPDGVIEDSWYHRLQSAPAVDLDVMPAVEPVAHGDRFSLNKFGAPPLPAVASAPAQPEDNVSSAAIVEGVALHALLERITHAHGWPVDLPEAAAIARWLPASRTLAATVRLQAAAILSQPQLERFFNPSLYRKAHNEMDVVNGDEILRFDRVVIFDDAVWILDYKRRLLDSERAAYRAQLARYRLAAESVFYGKPLKTALITADGALWEFD